MTPVDERPPAARTIAERNARLDAYNAQLMIKIAHETNTSIATAGPTHELTKPGDERAARGVPILGYPGCGGHIAGTRP
jgi:hypothetical protein